MTTLTCHACCQHRSGALHNIKELTDLVRASALMVWDAAMPLAQSTCSLIVTARRCWLHINGNSGPGLCEQVIQADYASNSRLLAQRNQFLMGSAFDQIEGMHIPNCLTIDHWISLSMKVLA
jgi:hypothetical protein